MLLIPLVWVTRPIPAQGGSADAAAGAH